MGCKDFGAPKIKLGFTAQKIHLEMRRRLMYCGNRSGDLSIYYSGVIVTTELFALMFVNKLTNYYSYMLESNSRANCFFFILLVAQLVPG